LKTFFLEKKKVTNFCCMFATLKMARKTGV